MALYSQAMMIAMSFMLIILSIVLNSFFSNVNGVDFNSKDAVLSDTEIQHKKSVFLNYTENVRNTFAPERRASGRADVEDRYLNTTQLIRKYGYSAEEYDVETQDGYVLKLFRLHARGRGGGGGPVVFLMHGLPSSSDGWVTSGADSLAFLLAAAGYDVWLGNARGNTYSKRHVSLSTDSREFWDFTWHESGLYDLPAMIDRALLVSQRSRLVYVGHAQGTTSFFVLCSLRPEYNRKIVAYVSLATITYVWHARSPVARALIPFRQQEYALAQELGLYEFLPSSPLALFVTSVLCSSSRAALALCSTVLFTVFGFDYGQIDYANLPVQLSHFPAGSSFKDLVHYLQLAASRRFAQFDYGEQENLVRYNQSTPLDYPLENVRVEMGIIYADNDGLSSLEDVKLLIGRLPRTPRTREQSVVRELYRVKDPKFNHFDYLWGKDAKSLVYDKTLAMIRHAYSYYAEPSVLQNQKEATN